MVTNYLSICRRHIDKYDESFDKITTRIAKNLRRVDNKMFYDVTTSEDPILERLAVENTGDVYATGLQVAINQFLYFGI